MMKNAGDTPRILFYDIEATNLKADFGYMLCCGFKWSDEKDPFVIDISQYPGRSVLAPEKLIHEAQEALRMKDHKKAAKKLHELATKGATDDSALVQKTIEIINSADIIVDYYGKAPRGYDERFINTRAMRATPKGKAPYLIGIPPASHIDLWETSKKKLQLHSNRLASVIEFLELDNEKTPVKGPEWIGAMSGDRRALAYVVDHCRSDVLALEEGYFLLRPLVDKHPRISDRPMSCPNCGSTRLHIGGYITTQALGRRTRYRCYDCGKWPSGNGKRTY